MLFYKQTLLDKHYTVNTCQVKTQMEQNKVRDIEFYCHGNYFKGNSILFEITTKSRVRNNCNLGVL